MDDGSTRRKACEVGVFGGKDACTVKRHGGGGRLVVVVVVEVAGQAGGIGRRPTYGIIYLGIHTEVSVGDDVQSQCT